MSQRDYINSPAVGDRYAYAANEKGERRQGQYLITNIANRRVFLINTVTLAQGVVPISMFYYWVHDAWKKEIIELCGVEVAASKQE